MTRRQRPYLTHADGEPAERLWQSALGLAALVVWMAVMIFILYATVGN